MRDLGQMGESAFTSWCAQVGLTPNRSEIDKTGWDFLVEFPAVDSTDPYDIHKAAFECRVQVKATDKRERSLPIKLSNLRRLITAPIPTFFLFVEFDGLNEPQRAFVIHVDNDLISKVLKRLHDLEQSENDNRFNQRTLTINYNESLLLDSLSGSSLKDTFLKYIGSDLADYVSKKKSHLEKTGFENGCAQVSFQIEGSENIEKLINASLGINESVNIKNLVGRKQRFNMLSKEAFFQSELGELKIHNPEPSAEGVVRFRETEYGVPLSFPAKLYTSDLNRVAPENFRKIRVKGDFFDIRINHSGECQIHFNIDGTKPFEIHKFRDALKLAEMSSSGKRFFWQLDFAGLSNAEQSVTPQKKEFRFQNELDTLQNALRIISIFQMNEMIDISLGEIVEHSKSIQTFGTLFCDQNGVFEVEYETNEENWDMSRETAYITVVSSIIGSHIFGAILVITGRVQKLESGRLKLTSKDYLVEERIVLKRDSSINDESVDSAVKGIIKKYSAQFVVISPYQFR